LAVTSDLVNYARIYCKTGMHIQHDAKLNAKHSHQHSMPLTVCTFPLKA